MDLITKNMQAQQNTCHSDIQITLEDDIIVPDSKPDIDQIIKLQSSVQIHECTPEEDRVTLHGVFVFTLLYLSHSQMRPVHTMTGQIPFEETIHMDGTVPEEEVHCHYQIEDSNANLINSRKINVRSIISFHCCQDQHTEEAIGTEIESPLDNQCLYQSFQTIETTNLAMQMADRYRIKDQTSLPKGKPNCETILYYDLHPTNLATRVVEDGIRINGDLSVFVIYCPEDNERTLEYFETELPFDGLVSCNNCTPEMIADVMVTPGKQLLEFQPDEDGELRTLDVELTLALEIKFYETLDFRCLLDAYSTNSELTLHKVSHPFRKLVLKNQSTMRIADRIKTEAEHHPILQLCNSTARVQIDEQEIVTDGIEVEGVLEVEIMYITEDDEHPIGTISGTIPFSHTIEVRGIKPSDDYELQATVSALNTIMLDQTEIEVKAVIDFNTLTFTNQVHDIVTEIEDHPIDEEQYQQRPGLVGFIVKSGDTLWNIAKEYHTTVEQIMEWNQLESDEIYPGDKLLIWKNQL